LRDDLAAGVAALGPHVDDPVGVFRDSKFALDPVTNRAVHDDSFRSAAIAKTAAFKGGRYS
jgi:hypothetical protein